MGCWSDTLSGWPDIAIHAALLPDGTHISWGHVEQSAADNATIWNPTSGALTAAPFPAVNTNYDVNLFCSGHAFLSDGRLLVVGGHIGFNKDGLNATSTFGDGTWINHPDPMNDGRWYPTVTALPQAANNAPRALVVSGYVEGGTFINPEAQVWQEGVGWTTIGNRSLPLYPFMHLASNGDVFNSGPNVDTKFLDLENGWEVQTFNHVFGSNRDYGSSVMYDDDKIIVMGGGPPTDTAEVIDLSLGSAAAWTSVDSMNFARRQLNATLLPDGSVLVTVGTAGSGFNSALGAVKDAEIWYPQNLQNQQWQLMNPMDEVRIYHSTAILLP
jgi:hypothetical protein